MRKLPLLVAVGGVSGMLLVPVHAGDDGLELLRGAAEAPDRLSFHGTQMVAFWAPGGTTSALVEVIHHPGEGSVLRVQANAATGSKVYVDRAGESSGITPETLARIAANYETEVVGVDHVAGRETRIVSVRAPGGAEVARYWLDRTTGLMLRREAMDEAGRTMRESVFLEIDFAQVDWPQMSGVEEVPAHPGNRVALGKASELVGSGWQVPAAAGSRMELHDVRLAAGDDPVLHLTYSDGVSSVSLFQQRGRLDTGDLDGWKKSRIGGAKVWVDEGFPTRVVWSSRGTVYTIVAECPHQVLDGFVRALPHGEKRRGVLARLGRGAARVGSWVNPFG